MNYDARPAGITAGSSRAYYRLGPRLLGTPGQCDRVRVPAGVTYML